MAVRVRGLPGLEGALEGVRRWPVATLAAYLFEGRECEEVRALLAAGEGDAHGTHLTWDPIPLSEEAFTAIERTFPQDPPRGDLDIARVTTVALTIPALHPTLAVPLRMANPWVRSAAARAAHLRFDYGHWADVYVATLTRAEASAILADPARRLGDDGHAELAARVIGETDASLHFVVPREGCPPPWLAAR